ncbi:MAG: MBL fold metallo-hydrolase [Ktedonobacteraceae bacterium]
MYFRQLRLPDIGCASYMVGDDEVCAVIDPRWDAVPQYIGLARQQGLRITHVIETHTHADHVSGATRLALRTGATVMIHRKALASYEHHDLEDGNEITVGTVRLLVIHTPGHSLDSICLLVIDTLGKEPTRLLSGDTLFVGEVGRPDLHGTQAAVLADALYTSLHEHLLQLGDSVEVYPAHVSGSLCGRRIAPGPSTTIGHELRTNAMLAIAKREAFVQAVITDLPPRPPNVERIVQLNRSIPPTSRPKVTQVTPTEVLPLLEHAVVIDGRETRIFAQGHLKGAINVPIAYGQFGVMVAWLLSAETPLLLIATDEEDLTDAIDSLMVVGMTNTLSVLSGEPQEWEMAGLTVVQTPLISVTELAQLATKKLVGTLIDAREEGEAEQGTIIGAVNLPYRLIRACETLPPLQEPIAVFCNSGNRSSVAASLLERCGLNVMNVVGGTTAWVEAGLPLICGTAPVL